MGGSSSKPSASKPLIDKSDKPCDVVVCGGGVIGVSTCWFLAHRGHRVVCLERRASPTDGTDYCSYRNGGLLCPSLAASWVSPAVAVKLAKSIVTRSEDLPVVLPVETFVTADFWRFGMTAVRQGYQKFAGKTTPSHQSLFDLANRSMFWFEPFFKEIQFGQGAQGTLQIASSAKSLKALNKTATKMGKIGCQLDVLDAQGCVEIAPALAGDNLMGGVFGGMDRGGDVHKFTVALTDKCKGLGVQFHYGAEIAKVNTEGDRVVSVETADGRSFQADVFVLALGLRTRNIMESVGLRLPIVPVRGYSITVPYTKGSKPLPCNIVDDANKLYLCPINNVLNISSRAEFGVTNLQADPEIGRAIVDKCASLFSPNYLDTAKADFHVCLRPVLPDDHPAIGKTAKFENLFVNAGHGSKGWTQSLGAAEILAHSIDGTTPPIDAAPYDPKRF